LDSNRINKIRKPHVTFVCVKIADDPKKIQDKVRTQRIRKDSIL
jgi:hypothetical protein